MDLRLPLLADANLHLGVAEEAMAEDAHQTARSELEKAEAALDELREIWPGLDDSEQGLLQAMARPLSLRARAIASSLPRVDVVSSTEPVDDPEQDLDPDEPA
jgi:hypothetical protein